MSPFLGKEATPRGRSSSHVQMIDPALVPTDSPQDLLPPPPLHRGRSSSLQRSISEATGLSDLDKPARRSSRSRLSPPALSTELDSYDDSVEPEIDNVIVLCSIALSNLSQIDDCRVEVVANGGLSLLAMWLDAAAKVLLWHNAARLQSSTPNANSTPNDLPSNSPFIHNEIGKPYSNSMDRASSDGTAASIGGIIPSGHPVYELINNISAAVASLTVPTTTADTVYRSQRGNVNNPGSYTIGRIDAQVIHRSN
jgi:hypothetical protein